jgi:ferrochelatase
MAQPTQRIGVLLAQLGTPDAPTPAALRKYLKQFLGDPRVVERNRLLWWFILRLLVLPRKSPKSAELYRRVWTSEGSPLLVNSRTQATGLDAELNRREPGRFKVALGMRYGSPSIESAVRELRDWGAERLLLFPAYPQYAGATTGSTYDEVFAQLSRLRYVPALRVVPPYYDHSGYIDALAHSVCEAIAADRPDKLVISFHGIPQMMVDGGDPYQSHCEATARLLASRAGIDNGSYVVAYQSRAGKEPWLLPNTDEVLVELAQKGARRVKVICPGFVADCLETIDEIGFVGLEQFRSGGGEALQLIPGLNGRPRWLAAMTDIALEQVEGWL